MWQGSKYASGCNYGRVLNILRFQLCQVSVNASIVQGSDMPKSCPMAGFWNGRSMFHRVLNRPLVLNMQCQNMACLWICEGHTGCWICLMWYIASGHCSKCWVVNKTETYSEHSQTFKMECFAKRILLEYRSTTEIFLDKCSGGDLWN